MNNERSSNIGQICIIIFSLFLLSLPYSDLSVLKYVLDLQLILYVCVALIDFITTKRIKLFQTWIGGFIFVILSEMIIMAYENPTPEELNAITFFLAANDLLILGYLIRKPKHYNNKSKYEFNGGRLFIFICIIFIGIFVINKLAGAIAMSSGGGGYGRGSSMGNGTFMNSFIGGVGIMIPACIGFYFRLKRKPLLGIILLSPIFIIYILLASRYRMLFAILPYLITSGFIEIYRPNLKKLMTIVFAVIAFSLLSDYTTFSRGNNLTVQDYLNANNNQPQKDEPFFYKLAKEMSPEGCIRMAVLANDYFSDHELRYGRESAFILYFWIPRGIWPEKPTMLDHWLIRAYYGNISEGFSTASGFMGELRADFGLFSLFFAFLLGFALRAGDNYVASAFSLDKSDFNRVFSASLFPYVFFFVRSPLTSSFSLISEILIFYIFLKLFTIRKRYNAIKV